MMNRKIVAALAAVSVLIVLAALSSTRRDTARARHSYSSYNAEPTGTKAFYLLLQEMGFPVERWRRGADARHLKDTGFVFISVAPIESFHADEITRLVQAATDGATLFFFYSPTIDTLLHHFDIEKAGTFTDSIAVRQQLTLHNHDADSLVFAPTQTAAVVMKENQRILYGSAAGHAVIEKPVGLGSLILFQFPDVVSNAWLAHGDNAKAAVHLLQWDRHGTDREAQRILFDEYHQGFRDFESSIDVLDTWPAKTGLTLAFVLVVLWATSRGKRFGRAVPLVPAPVRSSLRTIDSIADVYERAEAHRIALKSWFRFLLHQWRHRFQTTHPARLAEIFEKRYGLRAAESRQLLEKIHQRLQEADAAARSPDTAVTTAIDRQEMLSYFTRLEKIHQRILREKP
jgi:hypothetical protein